MSLQSVGTILLFACLPIALGGCDRIPDSAAGGVYHGTASRVIDYPSAPHGHWVFGYKIPAECSLPISIAVHGPAPDTAVQWVTRGSRVTRGGTPNGFQDVELYLDEGAYTFQVDDPAGCQWQLIIEHGKGY